MKAGLDVSTLCDSIGGTATMLQAAAALGGQGGAVADGNALSSLWRSLQAGTTQIVESFSTSDRVGLVVRSSLSTPGRPLAKRDARILEEVLLSARQKVVGIDMRLAPSSIASLLKRTLSAMGLSCRASRVPLLLVVAAHAARTPSACGGLRVGEQRTSDALYLTFTLPGPNAWLASRLSPRQSRVAALRVEGMTLAEIAATCQISIRTVANHLAAVYQTLGVGGRLELAAKLAEEYLRGRVPARSNERS